MENQHFNLKNAFTGMFVVILMIGGVLTLFYLGLTYIPIDDISIRFGITMITTLIILAFIIGGLDLNE